MSQENRGKRPGRKEKPWNCDQSQARGGEGGNRSKQERNNEGKFRKKLYDPALDTAVIMNWEAEGDWAETLSQACGLECVPMTSAGRKGEGGWKQQPLRLWQSCYQDWMNLLELGFLVLFWSSAEPSSVGQAERVSPQTVHVACKSLIYTWPSS